MAISSNSRLNSAKATAAGKTWNTRTSRPVPMLQQCLILSAETARQSMLVQAAGDAGWETLICASPASAASCLARNFVQMAIVDLDGQQTADFQQVLRTLQNTSGLLLVVCGNEGDLREEIFVRQFGPWLYLPGVEQAGELTGLCTQARQINERRQGSQPRMPAAQGLRRSG